MRVYHYCGAETLFNIVRSGEIWATHVGHMDDPNECVWALNEMEQWLDHFVESNAQRHPLIQERCQSVARSLRSHARYLRSAARDFYAVCFSKTAETLSQWRHYSEGGAGFAIEIDLGLVPAGRIDPVRDGPVIGGYGFAEVTYGLGIQGHVRRDLEKGFEDAPEPTEQNQGSWACYWDGVCQHEFLSASTYTGFPFTKNPHYQEEQEVRLVISERYERFEKDFRMLRGRIVPYRRIPLRNEEGTASVTRVILGPRSSSSEKDLKNFLSFHGFDGVETSTHDIDRS